MHQSVKLTDAIWLLHLAISSPVIHALGDLCQAPTGIRTRVSRLRGGRLINWAIPPPLPYRYNAVTLFLYPFMPPCPLNVITVVCAENTLHLPLYDWHQMFQKMTDFLVSLDLYTKLYKRVSCIQEDSCTIQTTLSIAEWNNILRHHNMTPIFWSSY